MVKRIGVCCLALAMTGLAPSPAWDGAGRRLERAAGLTDELLQLSAGDDRRPQRYGLAPARVAEVFPELVRRDLDGRPRSVRYKLLTSVLLAELERLSTRVDQLEAELQARSEAGRVEPLVRIRVEHE